MNVAPCFKQPSFKQLGLKTSKPTYSRPELYSKKRTLSVSPTLALGHLTKQLLDEGKTVYRFGLGESPFPVPQVMVEELRKNAHQKSYGDVSGLQELREVIAKYLSQRSLEDYTADSIAIAPGSKMLMYLLQLAFDGCNLILPSPSWVSYAPQGMLCRSNIKFLKTSLESDWRIDPDELDSYLRFSKGENTILYMNYPSNPCGTTYDKESLREIAEVVRRHEIMVLADEIYYEFTHSLEEPVSLARYYPEGTIISTAISKCWGAGGWRIGAFAFPENLLQLRDDIVALGSETFSSPSAPVQHAAVRAFEYGPEIQESVELSREVLKRVGKFSHSVLKESGIGVADPVGGFYLLLDFSPFQEKLMSQGIHTSEELSQWLLSELQVATIPGTAFYMDPNHLAIRIAFLDFDGAETCEAVGNGAPEETFIQDHCPKIDKGMQRIADWCRSL